MEVPRSGVPLSGGGNDPRLADGCIRRPLNTNQLDRDAGAPVAVGLRPTPISVEDHHMRYRVLLAVTFLGFIAALHAGPASAQSLVAATLPTSRSVQLETRRPRSRRSSTPTKTAPPWAS